MISDPFLNILALLTSPIFLLIDLGSCLGFKFKNYFVIFSPPFYYSCSPITIAIIWFILFLLFVSIFPNYIPFFMIPATYFHNLPPGASLPSAISIQSQSNVANPHTAFFNMAYIHITADWVTPLTHPPNERNIPQSLLHTISLLSTKHFVQPGNHSKTVPTVFRLNVPLVYLRDISF